MSLSDTEQPPPPMQLLLVEWEEIEDEETCTKICIGYVTKKGVWVTAHGDALEGDEESVVKNWAYVSLSDGTLVELE